jgi:hypothetical protein
MTRSKPIMADEIPPQYELHPAIVAEVEKGTLVFVHDDKDRRWPTLCFHVPGLNRSNSGVYMYWHGPDEATWAFCGIRFHAQREYNIGGDDDVWSPKGSDHEHNVSDFIGWLNRELDA